MSLLPAGLRRPVSIGLYGLSVLALAGCATHTPPPPAPVASTPPQPAPPPPATRYVPPPPPVSSGPIPGTVQDFVVNVGDRVYFDYDQYAVRAGAIPVLTAQANWLQRYPAVHVRLEGNADERGTEEYNLALGARRAAAVKAFMVEHGIAASRIETISYGKERPLDPGSDEAAWAKNRNVHTAITAGAQQ